MVTAVMTDVHYRMSLALIRDLAQAGVRTVCCEREGVAAPLGFVSKYTDETVLLPREGWTDALYDLCARLESREGERPALLPVGAATLAALSAERARFGRSRCSLRSGCGTRVREHLRRQRQWTAF